MILGSYDEWLLRRVLTYRETNVLYHDELTRRQREAMRRLRDMGMVRQSEYFALLKWTITEHGRNLINPPEEVQS